MLEPVRCSKAWRQARFLAWPRPAPRTASLTASHAAVRCLSCSRTAARQRLLWAGSVLDRVSPYLQEVPKDWLASIGMKQDADEGITFTHLAGSLSHSLLAYCTVPGALARGAAGKESKLIPGEIVINDQGDDAHPLEESGFAKIISIGRNTHGELGLGFTGQESSWGMVQSGFEGRNVQSLQTGNGTSYVVMEAEDGSSKLYVMGNHTSGQLGLGTVADGGRSGTTESGASQLSLYTAPELVKLSLPSDETGEAPVRIVSIAPGLDHVLVLCEPLAGSSGERTVLSCGINTDGQLGVASAETRFGSHKFRPVAPAAFQLDAGDRLAGVAAGGDTSFAWSEGGRVWSWGNSEYGQAGHGEAIDRIDEPLKATEQLRAAGLTHVKSIVAGGSFAAILDASGQVYTVGYGPVGHGKKELHALEPKPVTGLHSVKLLRAGLEYVVAATEDDKMRTWGLDTMAGRLALDPPSRKPWPSFMIASRFTPDASRAIGDGQSGASAAGEGSDPSQSSGGQRGMLRVYEPTDVHANFSLDGLEIIDAACSGETLWVLAEDGVQPRGVWDAK